MRHPAPVFFVTLGLILCSSVFARVGETQEEFERRLLQPSVGKFVPREKNPDPAKEEELLRQQPFNDVRAHFPVGTKERKYWKSAVPNMLSSENGWRLHVFFQDNCSVLEAYLRVGDTINEFEIRNILRASQGTSEWRKIEPDTLEAKASAIGCDYQLADGSLRARLVGNWLMVYSAKLDSYVKEQIRLIEENRARNMDERTRNQLLSAPGSTAGF
ncbi:hypothetical protein [Rariglobus hedericola]|nr:hypothetical protein [Rariglobus hedericola]